MAEPLQVVRNFDLYNTTVLLPGYTVPGYENELDLSRAYYSTDFSSNPVGSKIDFFVNLDDPCTSLYNPNPVFDLPVGLTNLSPQWFDHWLDQATFYSHPLVLQQLQANNPEAYQAFSDSVGTLGYDAATIGADGMPTYAPVNPVLNSKIPKNILSQMSRLNSLLETDFKAYTPKGFGANSNKFLSQLAQFNKAVSSVQGIVNGKFSIIKGKLPFNTVFTGNLKTPASWKHNTIIEGIKGATDRVGNTIKAAKSALSGAANKILNLIPKIKLPSLSKLINAAVPNMPAASKIVSALKSAGSTIQSGVAMAQGAMAAAQAGITAVKNTVGAVQNAITTTTGAVKSLTSGATAAATALSNITKSVNNGNVVAAMKNQTLNKGATLTNNALVTVTTKSGAVTKEGKQAVNTIQTFKNPPS